MAWRRSWAIVRQDARILRNDPTFVIVFTLIPLVVIAFFKPMFRGILLVSGIDGATGAEHAVPGLIVMFSYFQVGNTAFGVIREHGWHTWARLRASHARPLEIMVGKVVVPLGTLALQFAVLFGVGLLAFGLEVNGSYLALTLVAACLAVCLSSFGLALLALCHSIMQVNAFANLGGLVMAGVGGALAPTELLPGWAQLLGPATPTYWAMRGFRTVILDGGGVADILAPAGVLLLFAATFLLVARLRFRVEDAKRSWV
jgi:ABC-2 type transport system permease protein